MKNNETGKRVGFILASIHTGSSPKLWTRLAQRAQEDNGSFFVFPGGKLNPQPGSENQRNSIFSLANSDNLDGLISWASTIGGTVSIPELTQFHQKYENFPLVTIGQKIENHPVVDFDAYAGMKDLVHHFAEVHNAKKIAFIHGPENHTSAADRFRGYLDALKECGLPVNDKIITSPFAWSEGELAIAELYEDRKLVPGKDFDVLLAASDMMAFAAVSYLENRGFKIPKDLMVGGFNDSLESQIASSPFSTVHMPYEEIALTAHDMMHNLLKGDVALDNSISSYKVIRESCGCNNFKHWTHQGEVKVHAKTRPQLIQEMCEVFKRPVGNDIPQKKIEKLADCLFENDQTGLFNLLTQVLTEYFDEEGEISKIFSAISVLRNSNCLPPEYIEKIIRSVNVLVTQVQSRVSAKKRYEHTRISTAVNALKSRMLSVHERGYLVKLLAEYLPEIGIRSAALILYENDEYSKFVGSFNASGEIREDQQLFPSNLLLPGKYSEEFSRGAYVVQPLFMENQPLGYLICSFTNCDGMIYEDLRSAVSSTLQTIFLFEETTNAKQIAEQAEFAKTEFFANVGVDLCDPLKNLSAKITQMETNIEKGILDKDILTEQLIFIKSQLDAQLEKTETLVDLTRSQVDDLPMDKTLFNISSVIPGLENASFPLVYGDAERLKKAIEIMTHIAGEKPSVSISPDGLVIAFTGGEFLWQSPELLLAEKIIMLQYGELTKYDTSPTVLLPWPNLAGLPPQRKNKGSLRVAGVCDDIEQKELFGNPIEQLSKEAVSAAIEGKENLLLFWEPDKSPIDAWIKIYGLRHNESLFRTSIVCYSEDLAGKNFVETMDQKVKTQKTTTVLFVGTKHTRYGTWATDENTVSISSMAEFDRVLREITPSLFVFESIDEDSIKKIRQNPKTVLVPILVLPDTILSDEEVDLLCSHPRIVLCNSGAATSDQFNERIHAILAGDEILPPHTGALVKKAILYLNKNASQQIVRWKLADTVHVSEDYLTRIFHKEIGLSLWEYLNRYRIYLATKMLLETNDTIYEIAEKSGFQDQAYFCRVFKKIYGVPPGKIRTKQ